VTTLLAHAATSRTLYLLQARESTLKITASKITMQRPWQNLRKTTAGSCPIHLLKPNQTSHNTMVLS
jgi:hypothetical protein